MTNAINQLITTVAKNYKGSGADVVLGHCDADEQGMDIDIIVEDMGEEVDSFNIEIHNNGDIFWCDFSHKTKLGSNADEATRRFGRFLRDAMIVGFDQAFASLSR